MTNFPGRALAVFTAGMMMGACGTNNDGVAGQIPPGSTSSSPRTSPTVSTSPLPATSPSPTGSPGASPSPGTSPSPGSSPAASPSPGSSPAASPSPTVAPSASPAASVARFVTNTTSNSDYRCGFSPSGSQIVFERAPIQADGKTGKYVLNLVNTTGGGVNPVLPSSFPLGGTRPNWSPANNRIAFTGEGDGDTLWVCNPDGTGLLNIAPPIFRKVVDYPYWFPDGLSVAVTDYGPPNITQDTGIIRRVAVPPAGSVSGNVTTNVTVNDLTSNTQVLAGMSSVSPNGRYVALAAQADPSQPYNQFTNNIFVVDLQAQPGTPPMLFDAGQGRAPSWSPSGTIINFESDRLDTTEPDPTKKKYAIFFKSFTGAASDVNATATPVTALSLNANHCVWSRDSSLLVMTCVLTGATPINGTTPRGIYVMTPPRRS